VIDKEKIIDIFKHFEVPHFTEGKNVTKGWVNVQCPFPRCGDESNHCGVDPRTERFNCWKCGETGSFIDLLIELTGLSYKECRDIISTPSVSFQESATDYIDKVFSEDGPESTRIVHGKINLPERFELATYDTKFPLLYSYLERRNISINTIIEHECGICRSGSYMNRLVIPVFFQQEIVAFQAADLTGFAELKYKTSSDRINDYLYGYDKIENGKVVLVEGILDAWRVGKDALATFGTHITERQKYLILGKNLKELIFAWDGDAYWKARQVADFFRSFVESVGIVRFPEGEDPDSYGRDYGQGALFELIEQAE
jgi:DNA primase